MRRRSSPLASEIGGWEPVGAPDLRWRKKIDRPRGNVASASAPTRAPWARSDGNMEDLSAACQRPVSGRGQGVRLLVRF